MFLYIIITIPIFFWCAGKFYEKVCEACHITLNKIAIFGDNGIIIPGGVRIGKQQFYMLESLCFVCSRYLIDGAFLREIFMLYY